MMDWREDCLHKLVQSAHSSSEVVRALAGIVGGLGFEYCSYVLHLPFPLTDPQVFWSSTYPDRWLEHYFSHNYLGIDPLLRRLNADPAPIVWQSSTFDSEPAFWEEANAHGVRHGWATSTRGNTFTTGMLSLARSHDVVTSAELEDIEARLVWLAHTAHGAIARIEGKKLHEKVEELSRREREVLRWTAAGKTAGEVGIVLGISERTVHFHITRALAKLNAVNKTQAVMTATMLGMLS